MPTLEHAIALAIQAHQGQVDKAGQPYILHPLRVMFRLSGETEQIVGVLHDVIEDSDLTPDDLRRHGYSEEIITALEHVTRRPDETYEEFVQRSRQHPIACRVKQADLEDNMDVRRLSNPPSPQDLQRLARYRRAWGEITGG